MVRPTITTVERGVLTTTGGQTYYFERILVPAHHRVPTLYDVPSDEEGVSVRVEVDWAHVSSVELTNPDDLLGLAEWFHLNDTPLLVNGADVRDTAKHYDDGKGFSVHAIPRRGR